MLTPKKVEKKRWVEEHGFELDSTETLEEPPKKKNKQNSEDIHKPTTSKVGYRPKQFTLIDGKVPETESSITIATGHPSTYNFSKKKKY